MPWRICHVTSDQKHFFCFTIPKPWELPQPIRLLSPSGSVTASPPPSPWKWAQSDFLSDQKLNQLPTLAAIDELAGTLDEKVRIAIQKTVRAAAMADPMISKEFSLKFD